MRYVVTAEQMRELDQATITTLGLPGAVLMETAGRAVAATVRALVGDRESVTVVCGAGNNGGDGYVAARCLGEWGIPVTTLLAAPRARIAGDARLHLEVLERCGGAIHGIEDDQGLASCSSVLASAGVVVDALFGTGLVRPVTGHYAEVIAAINAAPGLRVAVDIPSGLAADTGEVLGVAVAADHTVTFAFTKPVHVSSPGFAHCGDVTLAEIGIPQELARAAGVSVATLDMGDVLGWLPKVSSLTHKGARGHAVLVAGSPGKWGAARLAAVAALRAGAGLVTVAGAGDPAVPDPVMTAHLDVSAGNASASFRALVAGKRAVAIGPGMSTCQGGAEVVRQALAELETPLVLDADALNHLGRDLHLLRAARGPVIITPHPGEAGRLLGLSPVEVERDRLAAVRSLAEESGAVVVLKGARTLVCDGRPSSRPPSGAPLITVNTTGGPALATAGSGDVLTGVVVGLLAQGVEAAKASRLAVWCHGVAGQALPARGALSSEIADRIPAALAQPHRV